MAAPDMSWLSLAFPPAFDVDAVLAFTRLAVTRPVRGLWHQPDPLVVETVGTVEALRWHVGMSTREATLVLPQLRGQLPSVAIEPTGRALPPLNRAWELRLNQDARPLRTDVPEQVAAALLVALRDVLENEALVLQWVVGPALARPAPMRGDDLYGLVLEQSEQVTALKNKLAEPMLGVVGRIGVKAASPPRQAALAQRVLGALALAAAPGVGFTIRYRAPTRAARRLAAHRGPLYRWPPVNAAELATVLGWPIGNPYVAGVTYAGSRQLPPQPAHWVPATVAESAAPGGYRVVGRGTYPTDQPGYVHLPAPDALFHLHVIGPTGSGKSVLLSHLIEADIRAGRSVLVVDPKSDLAHAVADRVPANRLDDVVWIDPSDEDFAVGFDVLAGSPEVAADRFTHIMSQLFSSAWGPKTAQALYNGALTLARCGMPLVDLPRLFTDNDYRRTLVTQADDPLGVGAYWQWFDSQSERDQTATVAPALSRLDTLIGRRVIRGTIGQPSPRFHLADLFTQPTVLLVSLARGEIGPEAARLLGGLLLSQFWQHVQAQVRVPEDQRQWVSVTVDEFQDYAAGISDFGEALSQSRGMRVGWTLAHQAMGQLGKETASAVWVNARSRVAFQQTAPSEAKPLAESLGGDLTPDDIAGLPAHNVYASLASGGATLPPVSVATLPPPRPLGTAQTVKRRSRVLHGTPRDAIDAEIIASRRGSYCNDHVDRPDGPTRPQSARLGGQRPRAPRTPERQP